jgi:hypothetical protein
MLAGTSGQRSSAAPGAGRRARERSSPAPRERSSPVPRDRGRPGAPPVRGPGAARRAGCSPRRRPRVPSAPGCDPGRSRTPGLPFPATSRVRDEPPAARAGLPRCSSAPEPGPPRGRAGPRSRSAAPARPMSPPERPLVFPVRPLLLPAGRRPLLPERAAPVPPERPTPEPGRPLPLPERAAPVPPERPTPLPERPAPPPERAAPVPPARRGVAPSLPAPPWPARPFWPAPEPDVRWRPPAWGRESPPCPPRPFPTTINSQPSQPRARPRRRGADTRCSQACSRHTKGRYQHGNGPQHKNVRRRPTLPRGPPRSTIGAEGLNFRVRNGTGCFPFAMATETLWRCQVVTDRTSGTAQWTHA